MSELAWEGVWIAYRRRKGDLRLVVELMGQGLGLVEQGGRVREGCGIACGLHRDGCRCGELGGQWLRGYGWRLRCCRRLRPFLGSWGGRWDCFCLGGGYC